MKLDADWLSRPETQAVMAMLTRAGHQAFFVGGCVRNALLGEEAGDIDIATDATPGEVIALAEAGGLRPVPTGIDHGTVTIVSDGVPHEVTTFRRDVATDGRRAVVAFTKDVSEDARRRDFTMNAIYATTDGKVIDPLNGLPDLQTRRVRFIDDAEARIREDYLRILRFFRFHAWYGDPVGGIDGEGLAACAQLSDGVDTLAAERVGAEMLKLLGAPDPAPAVAAMQASGCLARVLPGADGTALAPLVALETVATLPPDPIRRLATIGGDGAAARLRLSRSDAKTRQLIRSHAEMGTLPAEIAWRHDKQIAWDAALVRAALAGHHLAPGLAEQIDLGASAQFPVASQDLMPEYTGPALGTRLAQLEQRWIASGFTATREELLRS